MTDVFITGLAALTLVAALIVVMTSTRDMDASERRRSDDDPSNGAR